MEKTTLEKLSAASRFQGNIGNPSAITIDVTDKTLANELVRLEIDVPKDAKEYWWREASLPI